MRMFFLKEKALKVQEEQRQQRREQAEAERARLAEERKRYGQNDENLLELNIWKVIVKTVFNVNLPREREEEEALERARQQHQEDQAKQEERRRIERNRAREAERRRREAVSYYEFCFLV